jgi:hypothetical protein
MLEMTPQQALAELQEFLDFAARLPGQPDPQTPYPAVLQALAVLRAAVEWRPIESVPKDGREVLLLLEWRYPGITKAPQYRYGVGQWRDGNWRHMQAGVPVAWLPLPQPPEVRDG